MKYKVGSMVLLKQGRKLVKAVVIDVDLTFVTLKLHYKKGDVVGTCEIYLNKEKVGTVKIYSDRDIEKGGLLDSIKYNIKNIFK